MNDFELSIKENDFFSLEQFFKLFSSEVRLKIICLLYGNRLCINEIAQKLSMTQPAVSHHIKELRQSRIIKCEKEGQTVYCSLCDEHIVKIITSAAAHIKCENCD